MRNIFVVVFLTLVCVVQYGCVNSQEHNELKEKYLKVVEENEQLNSRISELESIVDDLRNGAARLYGLGKENFDNKRYDDAFSNFQNLLAKHPESTEATKAKRYITKIESIKKKAKAEADRKEKARQAEALRKQKAKEARIKKSLAAMRIKKDKVENITWYTPYKSLEYHSYAKIYGGTEAPISLYIGVRDGNPWLRLKLYYEASDWLFVKQAIAYVDGQKWPLRIGRFERDNGSGDIWEWLDVSPNESDLSIVKKIITSKEAIIRFYGDQYYGDRTVKVRHKKALQEALDAYTLLNG